jgi:hypothetical protein
MESLPLGFPKGLKQIRSVREPQQQKKEILPPPIVSKQSDHSHEAHDAFDARDKISRKGLARKRQTSTTPVYLNRSRGSFYDVIRKGVRVDCHYVKEYLKVARYQAEPQ